MGQHDSGGRGSRVPRECRPGRAVGPLPVRGYDRATSIWNDTRRKTSRRQREPSIHPILGHPWFNILTEAIHRSTQRLRCSGVEIVRPKVINPGQKYHLREQLLRISEASLARTPSTTYFTVVLITNDTSLSISPMLNDPQFKNVPRVSKGPSRMAVFGLGGSGTSEFVDLVD
jgi:hypothetical protein